MTTATILEQLRIQAGKHPAAPAILSLDHEPITYQALVAQIDRTHLELNRLGLGHSPTRDQPESRVALVMPNGPETALAFLSISASTACAPLNPNYREAEFSFYLGDLKADALLALDGYESPAIAAARSLAIPILRWQADGEWPSFRLIAESAPRSGPIESGYSELDDIALLLHTSGTTSRPKLVPLTHRNLAISALNIVHTLQLTPDDRGINVMPLFHIHGLKACLCAPLLAGGSVACTPGFLAPQFFDWLESFTPTWYSAVPTMHQAILEQSARHPSTPGKVPLRFLRSSSAPLPPTTLKALEAFFHAPMIEAYGMTEAAHQISSNPLPPAIRKIGSVGLPTGAEVVALAEDGSVLTEAGLQGEIGLKGPTITIGYLDNPEANQKAFKSGWFLTGDLGYFDPDGYLFLTGRSKEIINRGGEKISPREVDEALLEHPGVAQAMAFAIPDAKLGEDVGAAVVLKDPTVTGSELRHYLADRLATHKIPQRIVILDEIPKGPTGKPQRIGMADKLNLTAVQENDALEFIAPRTPSEQLLAGLWCEILRVDQVGIQRPFLELGGDSMTAMQLANRVFEQTGLTLSLVDFFDARTVAEQAALLDQLMTSEHHQGPKASGEQD